VSPQTGAALGAPVDVGLVYDGLFDYPWAFGRQTYQDSVFRTWAAGNITADPTNADHLALVWSDMRSTPGIPFAPFANPYTVTTNSDLVVSESTNGGQTWSAPTAIPLSGDQFMPWSTFDVNGALRIGTFDRSYDAANHKYGYSLLTQTGPGAYSKVQVTTVLSDPTTGDRWFSGATLDKDFPRATSFLGDYSGIAATADGGVVALWTDMRENASFAGLTLKGEDGFFAKVGP
jgi:hypothetical protein